MSPRIACICVVPQGQKETGDLPLDYYSKYHRDKGKVVKLTATCNFVLFGDKWLSDSHKVIKPGSEMIRSKNQVIDFMGQCRLT